MPVAISETLTDDVPTRGARRRRPTPPSRTPSLRPLLLAAGIYLLAALALGHEVLTQLNTSTMGWISADSDAFVWWLKWLPTSILRGESPLFTDYAHYPYGVNGMWNIGVPVLGLLMLPVTLTIGPVAAYNIAMMLGLVVSGVSMAIALVPWTKRWASRIVAGGLYAFAPFQIAHFSVGHLNIVWAILPPALLYAVNAVFIRRPRLPGRIGALVGVVLAVQTGIYTQTLALGALVLVITAGVLAVRHPHGVLERLPNLGRAAACCVVTYVALCAYPLYLLFFGPSRPSGSEIRPSLETRADPVNAVVPTALTWVHGLPATSLRMNSYEGEQGGYIGLAMLAVLALALVLGRTTVIRVVAVVGLVTFVFSLGPSLTVLRQDLHIWLPWQLLSNVPLLSLAEPNRLQIFIDLCIAMIVALWLDMLSTLPPGFLGRVGARLLTTIAIVSWLPAGGAETASATSPPFFATAADHLRRDDVVVTFPRPDATWVGGGLPMLWQADSGFAYRSTGGSFLTSDPTHPILFSTPINKFEAACFDLAAGKPPPDNRYVAAARQELLDLGVTVLLVVPQPGNDFTRIERWSARVSGSAGTHEGGVWLYRLTG